MSKARSASMRRVPLVLIALSVLFGTAQELTAQNVYHACYAPLTGAVYRIKVGTLRQSCFFSSHVEFSWTDGANAIRHPAVAPAVGQILSWNGSNWVPAPAPSGVSGHEVVTQEFGVSGGLLTTGTLVSCPAGKVVTGGGFVSSPNWTVIESYPKSGTSWQVKIFNHAGTTSAATAYAICVTGS